jgi:DNA polymerase
MLLYTYRLGVPGSRKTLHIMTAFSKELQSADDVKKKLDMPRIPVQTTDIYRLQYPKRHKYSVEKVNGLFANCKRCRLSLHRWNTVHTRGDTKAKIVLVGQSPGQTEDTDGVPFVGPSGDLLNDIVKDSDFDLPYIVTNTVACKPSDGLGKMDRKDPYLDEMVACSDRLWLLLSSIRPNVVIALGRLAATMFWKQPKKKDMNILYKITDKLFVGQARHPAYLLRKFGDGSDREYKDCIAFFRKLKKFVPTIEPHNSNDEWSLVEGVYPFHYLSEVKTC